jgi:aromatic-L-amino-acid decarboxylase
VRTSVALAQSFAGNLEADDRFEVVAPHPLSLVTFRLKAGSDPTRELMDRVNASGRIFLTHTVVDGGTVLRLAVGSPQTEQRHVDAAWAELARTATDVLRT